MKEILIYRLLLGNSSPNQAKSGLDESSWPSDGFSMMFSRVSAAIAAMLSESDSKILEHRLFVWALLNDTGLSSKKVPWLLIS